MPALIIDCNGDQLRLVEEKFNKIMWLWCKELTSDDLFQGHLVFGDLRPVRLKKDHLKQFYSERNALEKFKKDFTRFIDKSKFTGAAMDESDLGKKYTTLKSSINDFECKIQERVEHLNAEIESFEKKSSSSKQDYYCTPEHFAKMICVGFELFPQNKMGSPYLKLYSQFLNDEDKLEHILSNIKNIDANNNIQSISVYWKNFLTESYRNGAKTNSEDIYEWRKRTKAKYERILLNYKLKKTKSNKRMIEIRREIYIIKDKIKKNL